MTKSKICWLAGIFLSSCCLRKFIKIALVIHTLLLLEEVLKIAIVIHAWVIVRKYFNFSEIPWFSNFPVIWLQLFTVICICSKWTESLSLQFLLQLQVSPFTCRVLSGSTFFKKYWCVFEPTSFNEFAECLTFPSTDTLFTFYFPHRCLENQFLTFL